MTAIVRARIRCDWCGAETREYSNEPTARDEAHAQGWRRHRRVRRNMGDMCPMCLQAEQEKKAQP